MRYYDRANKRLVYISNTASPEYWDNRWKLNGTVRNNIIHIKKSFVSSITKKYISPDQGIVLEGGCGKGQHVAALENNGYTCVGVDYAKQTLSMLHKYVPELKVILSDVRTLPFRDEYFMAYWSLGVIEHFPEGFESIAHEMNRVLKNGGYLFLTFPYMSPIRHLKARFGLYKPWDKGGDLNNFYQFALDAREVSTRFKGLGFNLLKCKPFDTINGVLDEIAIIQLALNRLVHYKGNNLILKLFRKTIYFFITTLMLPLSSHCILLVFQKCR